MKVDQVIFQPPPQPLKISYILFILWLPFLLRLFLLAKASLLPVYLLLEFILPASSKILTR